VGRIEARRGGRGSNTLLPLFLSYRRLRRLKWFAKMRKDFPDRFLTSQMPSPEETTPNDIVVNAVTSRIEELNSLKT